MGKLFHLMVYRRTQQLFVMRMMENRLHSMSTFSTLVTIYCLFLRARSLRFAAFVYELQNLSKKLSFRLNSISSVSSQDTVALTAFTSTTMTQGPSTLWTEWQSCVLSLPSARSFRTACPSRINLISSLAYLFADLPQYASIWNSFRRNFSSLCS